jgi:alpha-beta hydrolase superfamily lysophospholipase
MRRLFPLVIAATVALGGPAVGGQASATHGCVKGAELWFNTADRVRLVGHRFGGVRPGSKMTLVLAHQSQGDLCEWVPYARRLAAAGTFVFAFDFRGNGFSRGRQVGTRLPADVAAAVRTVRGLGAKKVIVIGSSMGGIASLVAAANIRPALNGVVALSAPRAFIGMDALRTAPRLTVPVLYAAGREEPVVQGFDFPGSAQAMYDATASPDKLLELVPSSKHGIDLLQSTPELQRVLDEFVRAR